MTTISLEGVVSRLHGVIDPCSAATRVPLSIVEMGMVENIELDKGEVTVALRMTSPLCHALPYFEMEIERVLADLPGFERVACTFDHGGNWHPGNMSVGAKRKLAAQRELVQDRILERDAEGHLTPKRAQTIRVVKTG
jgi:metal-sulfur cluster biosynthetic enzyme